MSAPVREAEVGRACSLVAEIVDGRAAGSRDSALGHSNEDLLYALEEAEQAIVAAKGDFETKAGTS